MAEIEEYYKSEELPTALVLAGIKEIERHGLSDFSLRRVASLCGVSCAAPYRHYKNKNELILAVFSYINGQWGLLQDQIIECFEGDTRRQLTELCLANVKFWAANPNFRHVMLLDSSELDERQKSEQAKAYQKMRDLIGRFCRERGLDESEEARIALLARSTVYGTTQMLGGELESSGASFALIKSCFETIFS